MRVSVFNLPLADNDGNALNDVHAALQADICDIFGGFTMSQAQGGWRDDATGKVYIEPVAVYSIAMEDSQANRKKLRSLAIWHGRAASQEAVYVVHANGDADIVRCHVLARA